jgi:hypothetical protein
MDADPQVEQLTPEKVGCSQAALDAAKAIMRLDGLGVLRESLVRGSFDQAAMCAHWARIINSEVGNLQQALAQAMCYVEDCESDPAYKKGVVKALSTRIRQLIV